MVSEGKGATKELSPCFEKMKEMKMEGIVITEWKDIPLELLMRILNLVDDRTVIIASCVCSGWRDAISFGLTRLSLSWYIHSFFFFCVFVIVLKSVLRFGPVVLLIIVWIFNKGQAFLAIFIN